MGRLKLILGGLFVVGVALVITGIAILKSTDFNQYKGEIAKQVKAATGRDLTIDGNLELELSLTPKVRVDGVTLSNIDWGSRPEMVQLDSFAAQMQLLPLLSGSIVVDEVILIKPDILLETDKNGTGNWVMGSGESEPVEKEESASGGATTLPAVHAVRIEQARFTYKDGVKGEETSIVIDTMAATASDLDDPLNLLFKGSFNTHVIELSGKLGTPESLMKGTPLDLDLALKAAGSTFKITGKVAEPTAGKGLNLALSAQSPDIAKLAEIGGAKVGKVGPFEMAATVTDGPDSYKLGGLNLKIAGSDLSGDVVVSLGGKVPHIKADLSSNLMNIKDVTPASDEASASQPAPEKETAKSDKPAKIFPSDPLPIDGLKAVNADVTYTANKLIVTDFALNKVDTKVSLNNGKVKVQPGFMMGGGSFGGSIDLNGSKLPAKLAINLKGDKLGLGQSLQETGVTDLIHGGATQVVLDLDASGKSVAGLMSTLKGKTLVNVGDGKISSDKVNFLGGDLVTGVLEKLLPSASSGEFTPFKCIVVNLDFDKGITDYSKKIALQTDVMNVTSSGKIDLAKETLDIGVKPEPRGDTADLGINAGGLAGMVRLTGPLSAPGVGIDALGTAKAAVGLGAAIATGGVSLLVSGLADKALSDSDPCANALGKKSAAKKSSTSGSTSTQQKQESSSNPVGGLLNLFGGNK